LIGSSGTRYLVFERGQRTVLLSRGDDFTKPGDNVTFKQLEKHFTLKAEPEVEVVDKTAITTAEAIKLVKEAGYNVEKKNASKAENESPVPEKNEEMVGGAGEASGAGKNGGDGYGSCANCGGTVNFNGPMGKPERRVRKCRYYGYACKD